MSQKVDPSPTRHADTPRSQKGLAPLTRDPWFTFLVWGTSCEHNFSWTFLAGLQALSPFTKLLKFWVLVCPSPTRHADTPRSQKTLAPLTRDPWFTFFVWGTSCEHNFSWTFRLPRIKIVLIFRSQHPPYWWCLVCRTASRGASSLGCLRKSRWSKFLVEMWIFKIDLKFRFEFFCCGMQSCAHHFSHTGRSKIKLDNFAVPLVSLP